MAFRTDDYINWVELDRGSFGTVYRAKQTSLNRFVCIKKLAHSTGKTPMAERVHDEAVSMAQLQHPNLVNVYDFGSDDHYDYIVMEYVAGVALSLLDDLYWMPKVLALCEACKGVAAIHRRGWVHRDLKPSNILVTGEGHVKVADFGLLFRSDKRSTTAEHAIVGTASYMSPEQVIGEAITPASDVFSIGAMIVAVVAGKPAFERNDVPSTLHAIAYDAFDSSSIPRQVKPILDKCLSKDPKQRFQTAEDLMLELSKLEFTKASEIRQTLVQRAALLSKERLAQALLKQAEEDDALGDRRKAYFLLMEASRLSHRRDIIEKIEQMGSLDTAFSKKPKKKTAVAGVGSAVLMIAALLAVLVVQRALKKKVDLGESLLQHENRRIRYVHTPDALDSVSQASDRRRTASVVTDDAVWIVNPQNKIFYVDGQEISPSNDSIRVKPGMHRVIVMQGTDTLLHEQSEWKAFEVRKE